jgi:predicted RNA methylase
VDLQAFRDLLSPAGRDLLAEACTAYDERTAVAVGTRLRRRHRADLVAAAMTQAALRRRGRAKWGADADRMFFTRDGLEQATTGQVADYRARRLAVTDAEPGSPVAAPPGGPGSAPGRDPLGDTRVADLTRIGDLCCGVGGDLIALARAGHRVTGFDADPLTAELARANLAELGLADAADVEVADVQKVDRSAYAGVVADPARRSRHGRIFDPADYSPPWSFVEELLEGTACVKTAPIIPHRLVPDGVEAEWISAGGEVKEAALWSGRFRSGDGARRRATVLPAGASLTDADDPGAARVTAPLAYLYEPDGAVIRAGLVTAVAPLVDGALLHPKIAYLTSDRIVPTPFASSYRVVAVLPYDVKVLRRALREREIGTLTVKKRGIDVDPHVLRRRLGVRGPAAGTLVVTRTEQGTLALLVDPVDHASGGTIAGAEGVSSV